MEEIILVDEKDREVGREEKIAVHKQGKLHRAFSIFVFNSKGEMLIQKRAKGKYHSGDLWTNTCCSHPRAGENIEEAVHRRLKEEAGFDCPLKEAFSFIYKVKFDNGLMENELDHVFIGKFDGKPKFNPEEAQEWKWISQEELKKDVQKNSEKYTYWFRVALDRVISSSKDTLRP
ncbi:MAG: isopentenyl-diphosphate Delta-isomerase [Candidatus Aenigmarchaeota archaeon]|nr:isopentenyl-diphosphate Delta-isomerase [Candidatus Aenigmarchaeota archaeon]